MVPPRTPAFRGRHMGLATAPGSRANIAQGPFGRVVREADATATRTHYSSRQTRSVRIGPDSGAATGRDTPICSTAPREAGVRITGAHSGTVLGFF
jgi:hypothetical protein